MFEVGDVVVIKDTLGYAMTGSACDNLEGTIARIKTKEKFMHRIGLDNKYTLEFLELKIKDISRFDQELGDMAWSDRNLIPYKPDESLDIMSLFEE